MSSTGGRLGTGPLEPKVARLAARYCEHIWPKLEKMGGVPDSPMNRKERGRSSPAIGEHGLDVVDANRTASKYLRFFLEEFEGGERRAQNGLYFSAVLRSLRDEPGSIQNWRQGKTPEDREAMDAFWECMRQVARGVLFAHGEKNVTEAMAKEEDSERFDVFVRPEDEQQRAKTREAQVLDTEHTDRVIVGRVEELEAAKGLPREEAKKALARDPDNTWSYWRVERAIVDENRRAREGAA